jgi:biotin carboxyl carrier protein
MAMKLAATIESRTARLTIEGAHFRYEREGASPIEGEFSLAVLDSGAYSVLIGGRGYLVVAGAGAEIRVNGRALSVEVFDPRELGERRSGAAGAGRQNIVAPMPGKVVRLLVVPGDMVEAGQSVVVVEAMKMQNEMKSPKAGRVAEVKTRSGETVAAGDVLLIVE